jgi:two-component system chemotaxis response regulator CheY
MEASRRTALLVEDDPDLRVELRIALEEMGLDVIEAASGRQAVDSLAEVVPDLVVLDLMLPEVSGFEVCELIRSAPPLQHVPVLVTSARGLPQDRAEAEDCGADDYLVKPFTQRELASAVRRLLWPMVRKIAR